MFTTNNKDTRTTPVEIELINVGWGCWHTEDYRLYVRTIFRKTNSEILAFPKKKHTYYMDDCVACCHVANIISVSNMLKFVLTFS